MAGVPQKTLNWLWDVLKREYRDPQRTYSDLAQALSAYPSLAPRTDVYTAENGAPALLVHLKGTIPVNFRGSPYRFPLAVWIPHAYPYESPIVYVTPTDGMVIRPGQHVSGSDGRVYHPYLAQWRNTWDRSNIVDLLKLLAEIFGREPPVMSRPSIPATQQTQPQPPPRPPPPDDGRRSSPQLSHSPRSGPPPPPPKEGQQPNSLPSSSTGPAPGRYDAPLPLPQQTPRPLQSPPQFDQYRSSYQPQRQSSLQQSYGQPLSAPAENRYSSPAPLPNQQAQPQIHLNSQAPTQTIQNSSHPSGQYQNPTPIQGSYQPPPHHIQSQHQPFVRQQVPVQVPHAGSQPPKAFQQPQSSQNYQGPIQSQPQQHVQPKPTLKSAPDLMDESPFDLALPKATNPNLPTPAIPPNPEKAALISTLSQTILQNLHSHVSQSASALPALESQQVALSAAQYRLQQELSQLHDLQSQLQSNISALNTTLASADRTIKSARSDAAANKIPKIDEMIIPPTIVAKQLYEAVADQRGYEAAIQALNEGFVRGRIGGEVWSRKCRECAREEFRKKWLVKRISQGLGLDMSQSI